MPPSPGHDMPIALVGAACRLPGGITSLNGLWTALSEGRDLITEAPPDRFDASRYLDRDPRRPGKTYTVAGGFLQDYDRFDASYFGISPREAAHMDPQQRLLLEMAVEALDDAGLDTDRIAGTDTAVFVGCAGSSALALMGTVPDETGPYTMTGGANSIVSNRLSHVFDLRGPSMTVDTACSSALTAVHQACEALRTGRSRMAFAGGIGLLLDPHPYVGFAKASMLSPTGRCRTFSADADGFVRAEGGALVVLKPLADALADGDRVHAVIRATGVNSDGHTQGMALPSSEAQEELLRTLYRDAGVSPDELVYFEAHGTGTRAGDRAECRAVGRALATARTRGPLPIGSVKSNLGHLEAASGMPGLLKACLVLRHGRVPASLHAEPPATDIDFAGLGLEPAVTARPVPSCAGRGVVGVSSAGFGGANAHVLLEAAPDPLPTRTAAARPESSVLPVLVSARTEDALTTAVHRMADHLETVGPDSFYDTAWTACRRRHLHPHRAVVLARTPEQAADRLRDRAASPAVPPPPVTDRSASSKVVFAFSGNGSQWHGMGADLMAAVPAFRAAVTEVDAALAPLLGWSVARELAAPGGNSRMERTEIAQPALFALQMGLVAALAEQGVRPDVVLGHSVGEIAAACVAGALDLPAAARVVAERSRLQGTTAGSGRMAVLGMPEREARALLLPYGGKLEIAAVNSVRDVTVSGDETALTELGHHLADRDVFFRPLDLDYAFHSRHMDPLAQPVKAALADLRPGALRLPFASTVTGRLQHAQDGTGLDAGYWWRNLRRPVLFADAVAAAVEGGCGALVEVGPHPVLTAYLRRAAETARVPAAVLPTLRRHGPGPEALEETVGGVLAAGAGDWSAFFPVPGRVTELPPYAWQRERHPLPSAASWTRTCGSGVLDHPLLGERAAALEPGWHQRLDPVRLPWLADHKVSGAVLMPAAGYVEAVLAAGRRVLDGPLEVTALAFQPLTLPWDDPDLNVWLHTSVSDEDGVVRVASRAGGPGQPWRPHARGRVRRLLGRAPEGLGDAPHRNFPRSAAADEVYRRARRSGLDYGPCFRVLEYVRTDGRESVARYRADHLDTADYLAHPALLDGALQAGAVLLDGMDGAAFLPAAVDTVRLWRPPAATGRVRVRGRSATAAEVVWDVTVADEDGTVCLELLGCRLRRFDTGAEPSVSECVTELRAAPRPGHVAAAAPLPHPRAGGAAAAAPVEVLLSEAETSRGLELTDALKRVTAHFAVRAVEEVLPGRTRLTWAELSGAGVLPEYEPLLGVLLEVAEEYGLVAGTDAFRAGGACRVLSPGRPEETVRALATGPLRRGPELAAYGMCGQRLPDVLTGRCDPLELLFSESGRYLTEELYTSSFQSEAAHRAMRSEVRALVGAWPADRPLRVLEVGAGTGATTRAVVPHLPRERTRYVFTDVSESFFPRARGRLAAHDFVEYRVLDLNRDPQEQGCAEGSFDVVIASNVLHATEDVRSTLGRLSFLLADDGHLLVQETHDTAACALVFGVLKSFWTRTDLTERPRTPLLPRERWRELLKETGFGDVTHADVGGGLERVASVLSARRAPRPGAIGAEPLPRVPEDSAWIVVGEPGCDVSAGLAALLEVAGGRVCRIGPDAGPGIRAGLLPGGGPDASAVTVVLVTDSGTPRPGTAAPTAREVTARSVRYTAMLRNASALLSRLPSDVSRSLWLVAPAAGATPAPEPAAVPAAAAWGAARSLANEHARITVRRLAADYAGGAEAVRRIAAELLDPGDEDEIVTTRHGRFVARVTDRPAAPAPAPCAPPEPGGYALHVRRPGPAFDLVWRPAPPPAPPGPGEVSLEVRAAGLNYRDVLQAQAVLPPQPTADGSREHPVGYECAGIVTAVGDQVSSFAPGDRVCALFRGALRSHLTVDARAVCRVPEGMDLTAAATIPLAFLTAQYGLGHVARLSRGQTVLVHAAAGGVGLAAVQYAQRVGARVIATAGTEHKRNLLRLLGVGLVADSRTLDFAEQVLEATGGRGVDVVLNSLSGEAVTRSLELLKPGGHFVELGKRDLAANERLLLGPFQRALTFSAVDLNEMVLQDPDGAGHHVGRLAEGIADGTLRPVPHWVRPADEAAEAFRLLRHSHHIGKLVLTFDEPPSLTPHPAQHSPDPEGTYLVTGGLGGFGAATACWLAERGARHLALVGRRGERTPGAPEMLRKLRDRGVRVTAYAADAADVEAMRTVFADADGHGHPVRGVVHAAMHLDDAPLTDLDDARLAAVLAPKVGGALVLDELTRGRQLDLFVMYSSAAALIGNPHQAPYVGANVALESLARARRRRGEAALVVQWGGIDEAGYVARLELTGMLESKGMGLLTPREAHARLGRLLTEPAEVVAVGRMTWEALRSFCPAADSPRLSLVLAPAQDVAGHSGDDLRRQLAVLAPREARDLALRALAELAATVLQTAPERVPMERPLGDLGMDSLMAAELAVLVQRHFDCEIPAIEAMANPSLTALADLVLRQQSARSAVGSLPAQQAGPRQAAAPSARP
ncbi:SDR family NAD(P)-dependent oxidoreductase [Streptomyces sp. TRM43335]|uniref:SDR family NAD(P)-dependent oxidoreductase n=1 Tax=Streptomyces taklimakanensis TaxID=2569853 RepID=A0A6G2BK58_9ACTN|nr:type I polyketide synthase [Streptomyces taklimakanensis]MTE22443.1 SDR family NAD(P)-dependent oxidoreductase [Streptomyces taklimakanensis]